MHYVGYADMAAAVSNAGGLGIITALTVAQVDAILHVPFQEPLRVVLIHSVVSLTSEGQRHSEKKSANAESSPPNHSVSI